MPNLPDEIIVDILSRLPVVSLCRFRCVSKPWRCLISNPHFIRTHLNRSCNNHEQLALCSLGSETLCIANFGWSESGDEVSVRALAELDLVCDEIFGSCDGLLLTGVVMKNGCFRYSLVNPSTGECIEFPASPFQFHPWRSFNDYGFGYDSRSDDYKVVAISHYDESADNVVSVFALRTNSWKKIENSPYDHSGPQSKSGVLVSGALHWFAGTSTSEVIVALDLADEKFHIVPSLDFMGDELAVLGGCLCVYLSLYNGDRADFWVMKEYGVGDSWTKFTVAYDNFCLSTWKPLSSSRTGRVLYQLYDKKLVLFDPQEGSSKELVVEGLPIDFEALTCMESLVSPNGQQAMLRITRNKVLDVDKDK